MSAATPARDTDSSVEEDPGAGRCVDRAPRDGRSRARRDRRWTLEDQRRGGGPPPDEASGPAMVARLRVERLLDSSLETGQGHGPGRREPIAWTGPAPAERSPRGEDGRESQRRATGDSTRSRRTSLPQVGQPIGGGTDGAPERNPIAERRTEARLREAGGTAGNGGPAAMDRPLEPAPRPRTGSEGSPSTTARSSQATNGRRGAGRSDAARLPTRSKPSQGGSASGETGPGPRSFASTTDPDETWRTRTRYRLQHAGSRERRKPPRW